MLKSVPVLYACALALATLLCLAQPSNPHIKLMWSLAVAAAYLAP